MEKLCPSCHKAIPSTSKFCPECGCDLAASKPPAIYQKGASVSQAADQPLMTRNYKHTKQDKKVLKLLAIILIAAIILIQVLTILPDLFTCDHEWGKATVGESACETVRTCLLCGKTQTTTSHDWVGATCDKKGVCSRCGAEGHTLSHEYAFGKCKLCGESESFYTFTEDDDDDDFWFAVTSAQNLVKDELKSPSTAKFPWEDTEYTVKRNGSDWQVNGYVDAQNSFGAVVRTNWTAVFTMGDTSGSTYKVSNYDVTFQ